MIYAPNDDTTISDQSLISLAKSGDHRGFAMLFVRYQERLANAMTRLVGSRSAADDIVQDAFLRAFTKLDTFREEAQFYSWLFRIALNLRRSFYKHVGREVLIGDLGSWHDPPGRTSVPEAQLEVAECVIHVRAALSRIGPNHRRILILREYERLSYREIGERLGIELGTVRSRIARARAQMRREMIAASNRDA
jgi:RNA polymerase sigma-70 factor (ECF subfamily)